VHIQQNRVYPAPIVLTLSAFCSCFRFLLKDAESGNWFDVGEIYAREKVSHALRSRPNDERRRKTKPRIKTARKPEIPPELEGRVQALIHEQQALLKSMIEKEVFPGTHFDSVDGVKSLV
jgi:hypothetical protein